MSNVQEWIRVWVADKLDRNAELRHWQSEAMALLSDFFDPERLGHAVTDEVRQRARKLLEGKDAVSDKG
jgi:triphosphoribosyl-dephospho-CoA synthetase